MVKLADLDDECKQKLEYVAGHLGYYDKWQNRYRRLSFLVRSLGFLALVVGVVLPLTKDQASDVTLFWVTFSSSAQAALVVLILGGLLLAMNQVFMITASWSRHSLTKLRIEFRRQVFDLDWAALRATLPENVSPAEAAEARKLFRALVTDTQAIVENETTAWSGELTKAIEGLATFLREQRGVADSRLKEAQKAEEDRRRAAETGGAVTLTFSGSVNRLQGTVTANVAGIEQGSDAKSLSFAFLKVPAGLHEVLVTADTGDGAPLKLRSVADVAVGRVCIVPIMVPAA